MKEDLLQNGIITRSGITIDVSGKWHHKNAEIENLNILNYFKKNLIRIDHKYYIHNRYGNKNEFSLIEKVEGFPLFILHVVAFNSGNFLVELEYGEEAAVPAEDFLYFNDTTIGAYLKENNLTARLKGMAMTSLMNYLGEDEKGNLTLGDPSCILKKAILEDYI